MYIYTRSFVWIQLKVGLYPDPERHPFCGKVATILQIDTRILLSVPGSMQCILTNHQWIDNISCVPKMWFVVTPWSNCIPAPFPTQLVARKTFFGSVHGNTTDQWVIRVVVRPLAPRRWPYSEGSVRKEVSYSRVGLLVHLQHSWIPPIDRSWLLRVWLYKTIRSKNNLKIRVPVPTHL